MFNYIIKYERNLSFPEVPFFLYKLPNNSSEPTDWTHSLYFTIKVDGLNITNCSYNTDTQSAETGIMLVESIQNFKTYFSQIFLRSDFRVNVDFTRMHCNQIDCPNPEEDRVRIISLDLSIENLFWKFVCSEVQFVFELEDVC